MKGGGVPSSPLLNGASRYREVQWLRQWWLVLPIGIGVGVQWIIFIRQIIFGIPTGDNPAPDGFVIVFWLIFGIVFPLFLFSVHLVIEVRPDELYLNLFPLRSRHISLHTIQSAEVQTYRPLRDYGGWGWRYNFKKGVVYSMNRGVYVILQNGEKIMLGSQHPDDLAQAIQHRRH